MGICVDSEPFLKQFSIIFKRGHLRRKWSSKMNIEWLQELEASVEKTAEKSQSSWYVLKLENKIFGWKSETNFSKLKLL